MKRIIAGVLAVALVSTAFAGCTTQEAAQSELGFSVEGFISSAQGQSNQQGSQQNSQQNNQQGSSGTTSELLGEITLLTFSQEDAFSDKDYETGVLYDSPTTITVSDAGCSVSGSGAAVSGDTITITAQGSYYITGSATDVQIIVEAEEQDKVQLLLNGVSLQNSVTAPIYVKQADKVFITTVAGTQNSLIATFTAQEDAEEKIDAAIYAKDDLTLNGEGSLYIESTQEDGVVAKDDLAITSGSYTVVSAGKAFDANNSIRIAGGTFDITSGKDAFHSEHSEDASLGYIYILDGTFTVNAEQDAFDAGAQLQIENGTFDITTGGGAANATETTGDSRVTFMMPSRNSTSSSTSIADDTTESTKALKAGTALVILEGNYCIDSCDDAIHSDYSVEVYGGTFSIQTGDDAITSDTYTTLAGGVFDIITCYEGIEGQVVTLSGAEITLVGTDDGVNARKGSYGETELYIEISGGSLIMDTSSEGDGLDSNGSIYMSGGYVLISSTTVTTDTSLDYDSDGVITGGTFLATGSSGQTTQNFNEDSTQGSIFVSMSQTQTGDVTLTDSSGNVIVSFSPAKQYQTITISTADILQGETYTLTAGSYTQTITMDSLQYGEGNHSSMMGGNTTQNRR